MTKPYGRNPPPYSHKKPPYKKGPPPPPKTVGKITGEPLYAGELSIALQQLADRLEQEGLYKAKGVTLYLTAINEKGEAVELRPLDDETKATVSIEGYRFVDPDLQI